MKSDLFRCLVSGIILIILAGCANSVSGSSSSNSTSSTTPTATPSTSSAKFSVTYIQSAATSGSVPVDSSTYIQGSCVTVLGNTGNLSKTNNVFYGWNTASDGSGTTYLPGSTFIMSSSNVTLYIIWGFSVTYDANGATTGTVPSSFTYKIGDNNELAATNIGNLTRTNYQFAGWNTASSGLGVTYLDNLTPGSSILPSNENITLYALWIPSNYNFSCSYVSQGTTVLFDYVAFTGLQSSQSGSVLTVPNGFQWYSQDTTHLGSTLYNNITQVILTSNMYEIDDYAFSSSEGFINLTSIKLTSTVPPRISNGGPNLFSGLSLVGFEIYVPSSVLSTYQNDSSDGWAQYSPCMIGY